VCDEASSAAFAHAAHEASGGPDKGLCAAFDAEWRPDVKGGAQDHAPSLVQIGLRGINFGGDDVALASACVSVWLVDLEVLKGEARSVALGALEALMTSEHVTKLGFGAQADIDKLALLFSDQPGASAFLALGASHVVDLRDVCTDAYTSAASETPALRQPRATKTTIGGGLASMLSAWTDGAWTLDKRWQCSDWAARPLNQAQLDYAAADVACLFVLHDALCIASRPNVFRVPPERCLKPKERKTAARAASSASDDATNGREALPTSGGGSSSDPMPVSALETMRQLVAAAAPESCRIVSAEECRLLALNTGSVAVEINAIGLVVGAGKEPVLILLPADGRLDLRWIALVLGFSKKQVRLAPLDEVEELFGAKPGAVPPAPLRDGVRALCHPALLGSEDESGKFKDGEVLPGLWVGSAGDPDWRLVIAVHSSGAALRALWHTRGSGGALEALPDPTCFHADLDACFDYQRARALGPGSAMDVQVCLDGALSAVARKLRMIGVDAIVAGEVLRQGTSSTPSAEHLDGPSPSFVRRTTGVGRVKVDTSCAEEHWRAAALEGRLLVATPHGNKALIASGGGVYRMLAPNADPGAQFAELLELLGLKSEDPAAEGHQMGKGWGSRCGICNSDAWQTLDAAAALRGGLISEGVWRTYARGGTSFYRCGRCEQVFWPGEKYDETMAELKDLALSSALS
jgi:uncharacterized protein with PIN domain